MEKNETGKQLRGGGWVGQGKRQKLMCDMCRMCLWTTGRLCKEKSWRWEKAGQVGSECGVALLLVRGSQWLMAFKQRNDMLRLVFFGFCLKRKPYFANSASKMMTRGKTRKRKWIRSWHVTHLSSGVHSWTKTSSGSEWSGQGTWSKHPAQIIQQLLGNPDDDSVVTGRSLPGAVRNILHTQSV